MKSSNRGAEQSADADREALARLAGRDNLDML